MSKFATHLLVLPPLSDEYRSKWVLIPRVGNGDFSEIQQYVNCLLEDNMCSVGKIGIITPTPTLKEEKATSR
jgi:hypothetical protein